MSQSSVMRASGSSASLQPSGRRPTPQQPRLILVSPVPRRHGNLPFLLLCSFVLAAGLVLVLLLNMALSEGSYEMHRLQGEAALAADQASDVQAKLDVTSHPSALAQRATKLGMVPASSSMFLSLPDGTVLGVAPDGGASVPLTLAPDRPTASGLPSPTATASPTPTSAGEAAPGRTGQDRSTRPRGGSGQSTQPVPRP
ncbi:MAG: hypothetical protein ABI746_10865 [Dermatophilaceae bacterium]